MIYGGLSSNINVFWGIVKTYQTIAYIKDETFLRTFSFWIGWLDEKFHLPCCHGRRKATPYGVGKVRFLAFAMTYAAQDRLNGSAGQNINGSSSQLKSSS
jgi:hypothetical protein